MATQSEIKYNRLMKKAEEQFLQLGYKAVSMDQIAVAAGISKMTIYKHFPSKEQLFLKIMESIMDRTYKYLESGVKETKGTLRKIDFLLNYNIEGSKQYSLAFYQDIMDNPYIFEMIIEEKKRMGRVIFEGIIKEGIERDEIRNVDEGFMADMLIALMEGLSKNLFDTITNGEELENFVEKFYDFLKYGLLGGKGCNNDEK